MSSGFILMEVIGDLGLSSFSVVEGVKLVQCGMESD